MIAARVTSIDAPLPGKVQSESGRNKRRCCTIQSRREWGRFPTPGSRHHGVGFRPTEFGHTVEDVTPDRGLSPLRLAVPRRTLLVGDGPVSRVRCGPVPIHAPTPAKYHNARNRSVCCSGRCFGALVLGFLASAGNNLFPPASGRGYVFSRLTGRWLKKQVAPTKGVV